MALNGLRKRLKEATQQHLSESIHYESEQHGTLIFDARVLRDVEEYGEDGTLMAKETRIRILREQLCDFSEADRITLENEGYIENFSYSRTVKEDAYQFIIALKEIYED